MVLNQRSCIKGPTSKIEPQESTEPAGNQNPPAKSYQGSWTNHPGASGPRPKVPSADTVAAFVFAVPVPETSDLYMDVGVGLVGAQKVAFTGIDELPKKYRKNMFFQTITGPRAVGGPPQ